MSEDKTGIFILVGTTGTVGSWAKGDTLEERLCNQADTPDGIWLMPAILVEVIDGEYYSGEEKLQTKLDALQATLEAQFSEVLPCVHILWGGLAVCGAPGMPGSWPEGHKWTAPEEAEKATCKRCVKAWEKVSL